MFTGFTPETVDFLWGIRMNNNREWFNAHKEQYLRTLYEPMKALGAELYETVKAQPGMICKVSRIYRDARLHHPDPYKESLWISIRQDVQWWAENPCLYFEITPDGISYGFVFWHPKTAVLEQFRRELAANPAPFLAALEDAQRNTGVTVTADCYKRPKPCPDPRLEPFFAWKGAIVCDVQLPFGEEAFDPALSQRVQSFLRGVWPLYAYFLKYGAQ